MDSKEEIKLLFKEIELHREYMKMSKRDLAILADITPQYYSELLRGDKIPSALILVNLCRSVNTQLRLTFIMPQNEEIE